MRSVVRISALAAIACGVFVGEANAAAPASFAACGACHSLDGSSGVGPTLKGVYGRKAGSAKGFAYSPAMKKSGITWDDKSFDSFLADPQKAVPGNVMPFPGVADEKQRAEIIDYLKTVK
jgi:cytochrome c